MDLVERAKQALRSKFPCPGELTELLRGSISEIEKSRRDSLLLLEAWKSQADEIERLRAEVNRLLKLTEGSPQVTFDTKGDET